MKFPEIAQSILDLKNRDLEFRDQLIQKGILGEGYHPEMEKIHIENSNQLYDIINHIGYPTTEKVGHEAHEAAWIIIQHSISNPTFMKKCAELLSKEVQNNTQYEIPLAYLTDRIAIFEEKPQLYGTQFDWDQNGEMSPQAYDDKDRVNDRRKSIGLNSLEQQTEIIRNQVQLENQNPPSDRDKKRKELEQWKKKVGWKD